MFLKIILPNTHEQVGYEPHGLADANHTPLDLRTPEFKK